MLAALTACATPDSQCASELLEHRADGRVKMFVTARALAARAGWRDVYERGEYVPLEVAGGRRDCLFAFGRVATSATPRRAVTITCVPRLIGSLISDAMTPPLGPVVWGDTRIELPAGFADPDGHPLLFRDVFTGETIEPQSTGDALTIAAATLFDRFPVALLVPAGAAGSPDRPDLPGPPDLPDPPDRRGLPDPPDLHGSAD